MWRRTAHKKLHAGIKACKEWLKANRYLPLGLRLAKMARKVRGHYDYLRAVGNGRALWRFHREVMGLLHKWLNRRSQRRGLTWPQLNRLLERLAFPRPTVAAGKA